MTPLFYTSFDIDALWFAGTGMGVLFLGLLNLAALIASTRTSFDLCLIANLIGFVYGILLPIALPEPQAFLALLAFFGVMTGSIVSKKSTLEKGK